MNNKLKALASFVEKKDTVLDTCTDHAYLAIYLKRNQLCREVYASDININALNIARKNIEASHLKIDTYLSDGFKNIDNKKIDTVVIAGVGASTVLHIIVFAPSNIKKFIISSNNDLAKLRKELLKRKYFIKKEEVIYDAKKYYDIMLVTRNKVKENRLTLKYGKINNHEYYLFLQDKERKILAKIPLKNIFQRLRHMKNIYELNKIIKRISED